MPEGLTDDGWGVLRIAVPPELLKIGVEEDLRRFFDAMIYKLRRNAHKGRWVTLSINGAFGDLEAEVKELGHALGTGSSAEIVFEAADVANEALIVAAIAIERLRAAEAGHNRPDLDEGRPHDAGGERPAGDGLPRRVAGEPAHEG